ncbi:hypothetical protein BH20ACI2_BH20ACI2_22040 [soil metagenome]
MRITAAPILFILAFALFAVAQNKSVYTSTKANACRTIRSSPEGTDSYVGECRGLANYKVRLVEGDIRQTLDIITPTGKKFELNFWNIFGGFSSIGEKIEWRLKGKVPVALIARYNVADPENYRKSISYLMVSKIDRKIACVTDIVEPGNGQNEKARILADVAPGKPCRAVE